MSATGLVSLLAFVLVVISATRLAAASGGRSVFVAAVYEHAVVSAVRPCTSRSEALQVIFQNLKSYAIAVQASKEQGADIIVFPEYGVTGLLGFATLLQPELFFETVPDPSAGAWCPCSASADAGIEAQHYLSCLARNSSIYVVANMGDRQPCQQLEKNCRSRGYYLFNTNVVFDPSGCLVARYHKQNLFLSEAIVLDSPPSIEHAVFDTEFGRFGTFTCFDAVFRSPAVDLVEQYGVSHVVFPTAWMNVLPHYSAVAYHSAWARGMGVNYLAANIHAPQLRMVGSGIYSPSGPLLYAYNATAAGDGVLLVTPVHVLGQRSTIAAAALRSTATAALRGPSEWPGQQRPPGGQHGGVANAVPLAGHGVGGHSSAGFTFTSEVFGDLYTFVLLPAQSGSARVCQKAVCCTAEYTRADESGDLVALGAFDGMHTLEGRYYLEVCIVVRCSSTDQSSCGSPTNSSHAVISSFTFTSTTATSYVFPEILTVDNELAAGEWQFSKQVVPCENGVCYESTIRGSFVKPLISSTHFGRNYDRDEWHSSDDPTPYSQTRGSHSIEHYNSNMAGCRSYLLSKAHSVVCLFVTLMSYILN